MTRPPGRTGVLLYLSGPETVSIQIPDTNRISRQLSVHLGSRAPQNKCFFSSVYGLFIHCAAVELTGIFSDIMNLKDRAVRFYDSLVLPRQVTTRSGGYLGHGGEGMYGRFCKFNIDYSSKVESPYVLSIS